jgi:hypothetical protein
MKPREHGAWGLLLQPFTAGAILAGHWTWLLLPALGLILLGFMLREPLLVMARQAFVWRTRNPQTRVALRWLLLELAGAGVCVFWLLGRVDVGVLAGFAGGAAVFTAVAVWVSVKNRQRSRVFQAASAAVMGITGPFAVVVTTGSAPAWAWQLWGLLTLHAIASILVVHARLERRAAARVNAAASLRMSDYAGPAVQLPIAVAAGVPLAFPLLLSAGATYIELRRVGSEAGVQESLSRVGWWTVGVAIALVGVTVACLWGVARQGV